MCVQRTLIFPLQIRIKKISRFRTLFQQTTVGLQGISCWVFHGRARFSEEPRQFGSLFSSVMFVSKRYLAEGPGKLHRSFSCSRIACSVAKNLSVHPLARRTRLAAPSQPPAYRERLGTSKHGRRTLSRNRPQLVAAVGGGAAMLMNNDWWLWTALLGSSLVAEVR